MSFVEKAVEYNTTGLNCAESIIRAANEEYNLGIAESDYTMLSGFGSGVMTGNLCGAAAAGAAVLGKMYVKGSGIHARFQRDAGRHDVQRHSS